MAPPVPNKEVHQYYSVCCTSTYSYAAATHASFCNAEFKSEIFGIKTHAILDTGSSVTLLPHSLLTNDNLSKLSETDVKITGVSPGFSPILGKIDKCDVILGENCLFKNIQVYVTKNQNPVLIGNNILKHKTVRSFDQNNCDKTFTLCRQIGNTTQMFKIKLLNESDIIRFLPRADLAQNVQSRRNWLESKGIKLSKNSDEEVRKITDLLMKYPDVIGDETQPGLFIKPVKIPTNGQSKSIPKNHVPQALEESVSEEITNMLKHGIIEVCNDPKGFNSPVYAVTKSNGKVRVVANFKNTLNRVLTNPDPYPMPTMDSLFTKIGNGNKYFASMDLLKGYWQVEIEESDRHKTAFTWNGCCYQYQRLAFGLTSAGAIFSRCVSEALQEIQTKQNVISYIDDVLIFGKSLNELIVAMEQLFKALQKYGLKLNPTKCDFLNTQAEFLGRVVTENGYTANPKYIQGIQDMKSPTSRDENLKLVGRLVWIKSFLECRLNEKVNTSSYAELMKPIHNLNKGGIAFEWTSEAEKAFRKIKRKLSTTPTISFPDFTLPFALTTDASDRACGAILMQEHSNGKKSIVAAISRTFNPTEQNWSTTEREAFCIKWAILKFDYFLRSRSFTLFTDHRSLIYLDRKAFNNAKLRRWQDELKAYSFVLQYIEGSENVWADMLSRSPGIKKIKIENDPEPAGKYYNIKGSKLKVYIPSWVLENLPENKFVLTMEPTKLTGDTCYAVQALTATGQRQIEMPKLHDYINVALSQSEDLFLGKIIRKLIDFPNQKIDWDQILDPDDHRSDIFKNHVDQFQLEPGTNLLLLRKSSGQTLMVIPSSLRPKFLHFAHDRMNHAGITRTIQHLSNFWWEKKQDDIRSYIDSCQVCARRKGNYGRSIRWDVGHCRRGTRPFEIIYLDFVFMPQCRGKRYILTILDSFSRYFMAIPFAHDRAIDAARGLYQLYLQHREKPVIVSSDRGTHFTGAVFQEYCKLMDIDSKLHTPWRPQSSGNIERQHRTMKNSIFIICEERKCQWLDILNEVISNMNAMVNVSTGVSPHYIITGRHPSLNLPVKENEQIRHPDPASYVMKVNQNLMKVHKAVAISAAEADEKMEARLNSVPSKPLHPGDKVLLYRPQSAEAKRTKLPWLKNYTVVKSNNMVVQIRNEENDTCWVHRTQLRFIPDRPEHLQSRTLMVPVPVTMSPPIQFPQPPIGERQNIIGSSGNRRSKIPRAIESEKLRQIRRSAPIQSTNNQISEKQIVRSQDVQPVHDSISISAPNTSSRLKRLKRNPPAIIPPAATRTRPIRKTKMPGRFKDYTLF